MVRDRDRDIGINDSKTATGIGQNAVIRVQYAGKIDRTKERIRGWQHTAKYATIQKDHIENKAVERKDVLAKAISTLTLIVSLLCGWAIAEPAIKEVTNKKFGLQS